MDCFCCVGTSPLVVVEVTGLRDPGPLLVSFADDLNWSNFPGGFCIGEFIVADDIVDAVAVVVVPLISPVSALENVVVVVFAMAADGGGPL